MTSIVSGILHVMRFQIFRDGAGGKLDYFTHFVIPKTIVLYDTSMDDYYLMLWVPLVALTAAEIDYGFRSSINSDNSKL